MLYDKRNDIEILWVITDDNLSLLMELCAHTINVTAL